MSDFDWIEQHVINPWLEYDAILFDIEPTKEDVTKYINMALQTLEFGNRGAWEAFLSGDSEYLIDVFREWGSSYIIMTEFDNLLQGHDVDYLRGHNVIKYSELVGNQLTESESDGLDWIREITPWVPFQQAEIDKLYGIKKNDLLLQVLIDCGSGQRIYYDSVSVEVLDKDEVRHMDVHCGSGNEDRVLSLYLRFYGQDTKSLGAFWVTEDMVTLYQLYDNLTESDEWEWVREIPDSIPFNELENDKKYKYVPNQNFYGAVKSCGMGDKISDQITYVKVMITLYDESEKIPYNDIYCHHKRQDWVSHVVLRIYDDEGNNIRFAVTEDMGEFYPLSEQSLKNLLKLDLNESEDELNWIRETPLNPWYDYDSIDFDIEPTDEDVNHYIELALQTRELINRDAWGSGRKFDIISIKDYARDGDCQLVINQWDEMTYGPKRFVETNKRIKYSELKQNTITESEDLDWIINTNPEDVDVISFFQEGKCYYMGKLTNRDIDCIKFEKYDPKDTAHSYEDGRGLLQFGTYWYSPKFIEEMLKEKNITLYDLETKENISNLMESNDEMDWIINTEIPIQPGTMYRSSDEQTLREVLQLIEDKFPKAKWMSGVKPTEFFPSLDDFAGRRRKSNPTIVFQDDYTIYFRGDSLSGVELNYQLIEL